MANCCRIRIGPMVTSGLPCVSRVYLNCHCGEELLLAENGWKGIFRSTTNSQRETP
jgi:hypothetical protein